MIFQIPFSHTPILANWFARLFCKGQVREVIISITGIGQFRHRGHPLSSVKSPVERVPVRVIFRKLNSSRTSMAYQILLHNKIVAENGGHSVTDSFQTNDLYQPICLAIELITG